MGYGTCGPDLLLHIEIGIGTAAGKVSSPREPTSGSDAFVFLKFYLNCANICLLLTVCNILMISFGINLQELFDVAGTDVIAHPV